jgi:lysophospholipase
LSVKKLFCTVLLVMLFPCRLFAIPEADFEKEYQQLVVPFYDSGVFGEFTGKDGIRISHVRFERADEKGALVILHGKSESYIKYAELVSDLRELGLSVYLMDLRGLGFSGRMLADDPEKVYVGQFDDYIADLKTFMETVVSAKPHKRIFLIAHSLGGCIAARYLETYPEDVTATILSSPMLQIDTGSYPPSVAYAIAALSTAMGNGSEYAIGQGPRGPQSFFSNTTSHSYARWSLWENELIGLHPEIRSGGATYHWVEQSMAAGLQSRLEAAKITAPLLLLQAEEDSFVKPQGQDDFCERAPDCSRVFFHDARHEILMETDPIRDIALNYIKSFIRQFLD